MKQLRQGTKGRKQTFRDRSALCVLLDELKVRSAVLDHKIAEVRRLLSYDYLGVHELNDIQILVQFLEREKKKDECFEIRVPKWARERLRK